MGAKRKVYSDVHAGQIWRDRDPRMNSGNRRVKVTSVVREGDRVRVVYQEVFGPNNVCELSARTYYSAYDRFQRAFDLLG